MAPVPFQVISSCPHKRTVLGVLAHWVGAKQSTRKVTALLESVEGTQFPFSLDGVAPRLSQAIGPFGRYDLIPDLNVFAVDTMLEYSSLNY